MAYDYSNTLLQPAKTWAQTLTQTGWLTPTMLALLDDAALKPTEKLFQVESGRPLLVAFMGGTGVGKSSLLNRLAGKPIAIAGVERPTSKEVTLYHHQSLAIQSLPAHLPLPKIRIAAHDDLLHKQLIWLDMPDFDSTERKNQDLVLEWLPYIDVLIYVVSPERYRDNKAWRLLLAEGAKHAWVFVFNQWDKGFGEQFDDFKAQLNLAGFQNPLVFKTDCSLTLPDEFTALQQTLVGLATEQTVQQLNSRAEQLSQQALINALQTIAGSLGSTQGFDTLLKHWPQQWQKTTRILQQGFVWPMQLHANQYADHQSSATKSLSTVEQTLWDDWAQNRVNDILDEVIHSADNLMLPITPLKHAFNELRNKIATIMNGSTGLSVRQALANPGSPIQQAFLKFSQFCELTLPVIAMGLVGYTVFQGYYHSNLTHQNYLGLDFAIHSTLLVGLSWLIPFFMRRKLKPSLQRAALKGLQTGIAKGLTEIEIQVNQILENVKQQRLQYSTEADLLIATCQQPNRQNLTTTNDNALDRMLTIKT